MPKGNKSFVVVEGGGVRPFTEAWSVLSEVCSASISLARLAGIEAWSALTDTYSAAILVANEMFPPVRLCLRRLVVLPALPFLSTQYWVAFLTSFRCWSPWTHPGDGLSASGSVSHVHGCRVRPRESVPHAGCGTL